MLNINDWILKYKFIDNTNYIGMVHFQGADFQNQNVLYLNNYIVTKEDRKNRIYRGTININSKNLMYICVYFTVRKVIAANWINDRDQFFEPNSIWENDIDFQNDCLIYTLFNNNVQEKYGANHWIPFSEPDVNARNNFESHFMYDFINGNISETLEGDLFTEKKKSKKKALVFSNEAKTVLKAGKKLWKYYHSQPTANVNASLYDIREFFQGRDDSGKMYNKSGDDTYSVLIKELRQALSILADKIKPKVYKYGFLIE
jgi:hypothetical protein